MFPIPPCPSHPGDQTRSPFHATHSICSSCLLWLSAPCPSGLWPECSPPHTLPHCLQAHLSKPQHSLLPRARRTLWGPLQTHLRLPTLTQTTVWSPGGLSPTHRRSTGLLQVCSGLPCVFTLPAAVNAPSAQPGLRDLYSDPLVWEKQVAPRFSGSCCSPLAVSTMCLSAAQASQLRSALMFQHLQT